MTLSEPVPDHVINAVQPAEKRVQDAPADAMPMHPRDDSSDEIADAETNSDLRHEITSKYNAKHDDHPTRQRKT